MLPLDKKIYFKGPVSITIINDNSLQGPVFHLGTTLVPHGELAIIQPPNIKVSNPYGKT